MRASLTYGAFLGVAVLLATSGARDASACGGEFAPSPPPGESETVTTDHKMILSISQQQTTLWDEIDFSGSPSSFAWVLPIKGTATIGLSADVLFTSLDTLTATEVLQPVLNCPPPPNCDLGGPEEGEFGGDDAGAGGDDGGVDVLSQAQVGPYETVQLQSTDPNALANWLTAHGYAIPSGATAVISAYVQGGFNFLALKLAPGQGVTTMRPVRVTTQGASAVLPLRMVSVGTGTTTGITLWVIGDGRYEPQNFPFFTIKDSDLVWDWDTETSNYETIRTSKEAALNGAGWQVESSLELAQSAVTSLVETGSQFGGGDTQSANGVYLPVGTTGLDGGADAAMAPADAGTGGSSDDGGDQDDAEGDENGTDGADMARQQDLTTLFAGVASPNARVTRMRSDIAHSALTADLTLQASSDQSELSNLYTPASTSGTAPTCPTYEQCTSSGADGGSGSTGSSGSGAGTGTAKTSASGGGGCSTAANTSPAESFVAWGTLLAFLGFGASRARRGRKGASIAS